MSDAEDDSMSRTDSDNEDNGRIKNNMDGFGITENTKVLVTGGNGYLGSHIVMYLLESGFSVKVSVSDYSDEKRYSHLKNFKNSERLEIVEGKLSDKDCWENILSGCGAVIHVASPTPFKAPKQELEVIFPAVEGTLAILHAAANLGIRRVIMTSCFSAVKGGKYKLTYNEDSWGEPENVTSIEKSKIFAERAAWYFQKENSSKIDLTVICPGFLIGPCLQNHYDFSSGLFFKKFMDGRVTSLLKMHVPICDVRDAALVHVKALKIPSTINNRYICVQGSHWFENFSGVLSREFETNGFQFPSKIISAFPLKLIAFFDSGVKTMLPFYGKEIFFSNERLKKDFDNFIFRSFDESLIDMAKNFLDKKFIDRVKVKQVQDEMNEADYKLPDLEDEKIE